MSAPLPILLIEDNPGDVRLIQELAREAFGGQQRVVWVDRLSAGLARLADEHFAAVLLDLSLPDSQGLETVRAIRSLAPRFPIIVLTGHDDETLALEAVREGVQDYLVKGQFDSHLLARALRYAVERKRLAEDLRASEERFRELAENARDMLFRYRLRPERRFEYVSPAATVVTGYSPEEFYHDPHLYMKVVPAEDRTLLETMARTPTQFSGQPFVHRWIRKDGTISWSESRFVPVLAGTGEVVALEGVVRDITERRRAEEALRASEERFRTLLQTAPAVILLLSPDHRILEFNHEAEWLYGRKREDVLGKNYLELFLPGAVRDPVAADITKVLAGIPTRGYENPVRASDGRERILLWNVERMLNHEGQPVGIVAVGQDITERKLAEAALQKSEESLARAQEIAHIGSWDWDVATEDLRWSDETYRIFGSTPQEFGATYAAFLQFVHPEDRAALERAVDAALSRNESYSIEHRIVRQDGSERIVHEEGAAVFDAGGRPVRMIGTVQDITERKQAEEERERLLAELEAERNWLQTVIERAPAGILLIKGPGGERITANRAAEELLGRPVVPERGMFQYIGEIFHPGGTPLAREELVSARALRGELVNNTEEKILRRPDGGETSVMVSGGPIRDSAGKITGAVVIFKDITHIKELERLREDWISIVAHDLRQPITAISGFAGLLARKTREAPQLQTHVEHIVASARQLNRMIADLLDASRIEARRLTLERQPVDLPALVAAAVERTAEATRAHPVRVEVRGDIPRQEADPGRLEQVLSNLLSNAAKYGYPDTEILVEVERRGGEIQVSVTNQGKGIAPEELPNLFTRFRRTRQAREERIGGIGLGLYITKGLVEAQGGRIWAESMPGQTTTFRFVLPVTSAVGGVDQAA